MTERDAGEVVAMRIDNRTIQAREVDRVHYEPMPGGAALLEHLREFYADEPKVRLVLLTAQVQTVENGLYIRNSEDVWRRLR